MSTTRPARRLVAGACAGVVLVVLGATGAFGAFRASTNASTSVGSGSLSAPTQLTTQIQCSSGQTKGTLTTSWTATPSLFATGYTVVYTESGSTTTHTTASRTTTSDTYTLAKKNTTISVTVKATFSAWSSAGLTVANVANTC